MGVGIVAKVAYDRKRDTGLRALDASKLFGSSPTLLGMRENSYLRGYTYEFIEMFSPDLTRAVVDDAMRVNGDRASARKAAAAPKERSWRDTASVQNTWPAEAGRHQRARRA